MSDPIRSMPQTSWVSVPSGSDFPLANLPFGISSRSTDHRLFAASIIGDQVIDLSSLAALGAFDGIDLPPVVLEGPVLNPLISLGKPVTRALRQRLMTILADGQTAPRWQDLRDKWLIPVNRTEQHLPLEIGDYTDFYSSLEHATNVGMMFRDPANPLLPNWKHMPVGYHGRASSIRVSGHSFPRPHGQIKPADGPPVFGSSRMMDFELEMAFVIGRGNDLGAPILAEDAEEHIFGLMLFNDWSARDIQRWEYVPLGPFLGKNFVSTVSPWIIPLEALEPFRTEGPVQDPEVLDYLHTQGPKTFDIELEVSIRTPDGTETPICRSNFRHLYWNMSQQLAHHTVNGCNMRTGDLCASGTISGPTADSFGSMLELAWGGSKPVRLSDGSERKSIQDGDTVILRGWSERHGLRIGFGDCSATLLPATS